MIDHQILIGIASPYYEKWSVDRDGRHRHIYKLSDSWINSQGLRVSTYAPMTGKQYGEETLKSQIQWRLSQGYRRLNLP